MKQKNILPLIISLILIGMAFLYFNTDLFSVFEYDGYITYDNFILKPSSFSVSPDIFSHCLESNKGVWCGISGYHEVGKSIALLGSHPKKEPYVCLSDWYYKKEKFKKEGNNFVFDGITDEWVRERIHNSDNDRYAYEQRYSNYYYEEFLYDYKDELGCPVRVFKVYRDDFIPYERKRGGFEYVSLTNYVKEDDNIWAWDDKFILNFDSSSTPSWKNGKIDLDDARLILSNFSMKGFDIKITGSTYPVEKPQNDEWYSKLDMKMYFVNHVSKDEIRKGNFPSFYQFYRLEKGHSFRTQYDAINFDFLIEIKSSKLNPNVVNIFYNGKLIASDIDIPEDFSYFAIKTNKGVYIDSIKYKIPYSCVQGDNYLLAMETFAGPQDISLYSTRYPVKSFCLEHPAIITDSRYKGSTTTAEIYEKLLRGEVLHIPETQTWTLFYIFYNDGSVPMACPEGAYDVKNNRCVNVTGIVYFCSEGTFDPSIGACVVTPEQKIICPQGRYDASQDACIYNPPIQAVCEKGDYNSVTGKCEYYPDTEAVCQEGTQFNSVTGKCEYYPDVVAICPSGTVWNKDNDRCEYTPDIAYVCDSGFTYNPETEKCEYRPPESILCKEGYIYNSEKNTCEMTPESKIICGSDYVYNPVTRMCEKYPEAVIICSEGFTYNPLTGKCEKRVPTEYLCDGEFDPITKKCTREVMPDIEYVCKKGVLYQNPVTKVYSCVYEPEYTPKCTRGYYDAELDKCVYTPQTHAVCSEGDYYDAYRDICIHQPDTEIVCISGSWDKERNACVVTPNIQYLCLKGELSADKTACIIKPTTKIICEKGFIYDEATDKCIKHPEGEVICPEGYYYNSEKDKCIKMVTDIIVQCPENSTYDPNLDKCVVRGKIFIQEDIIKEKIIEYKWWIIGFLAFLIILKWLRK